MTNQEINEAVHKKLGGDKVVEPVLLHTTNEIFMQHIPAKDYCGSIQAAWEVVGWITKTSRSFSLYVNSGRKWTCSIGSWGNVEPDAEVNLADTAPMSICLAFLKLP